MRTTQLPVRYLFGLWLLAFYVAWLCIVIGGDYWNQVLAHWPIAVAMSFGSYVAGSTPMGGGTVGFPVLVLLFDLPGSLGRNFGLAVQSIGMVSASIYILSQRQKVDWDLLRPACYGALVGTPLGAAFVAPYVPDLWVKLIFAIVWASFGIMHLVKLKELVAAKGQDHAPGDMASVFGWSIGITGGVVSSITGVGIDMILYAVMVLMYRADLKVSIPTSVIIMAWTSLIGIASNNMLAMFDPSLYRVDPEVFYNWLAAAPVVALGAPFGAIVVNLISRTPTLIIVSILCLMQFLWTVYKEQVGGWALAGSVVAIVIMNGIFMALYHYGHRKITGVQPDLSAVEAVSTGM